jgi:hypothetical protein
MGIASQAFMYSVPSLALAALDMTALSILEMLSMAPLLGGSSTLDEQKKWPPAWLLAAGSLRYEALLWTASTKSLFLYVRIASGLVAT